MQPFFFGEIKKTNMNISRLALVLLATAYVESFRGMEVPGLKGLSKTEQIQATVLQFLKLAKDTLAEQQS